MESRLQPVRAQWNSTVKYFPAVSLSTHRRLTPLFGGLKERGHAPDYARPLCERRSTFPFAMKYPG